MKTIPLTQGKAALVDDEDYEWLSQHKWCAVKCPTGWYAMRGVHKDSKCTGVRMHREILKPPAGMETDHVDGDGLNNQRYNLRAATHAQNGRNRRKQKRKATSQFKGVSRSWHEAGWTAQIVVKNQYIYLGYFGSEIEAAKEYDVAARKYFGEFANTNFILT